jgi:hypothetical protein
MDTYELKHLYQERKWLFNAAAGVLLLCVAFWGYRLVFAKADGLMTSESLAADVSVTFSDTGETIKMPRGDVIRQLLDRPGSAPLAPTERIGHPKTGKQTGMVGSESAWKKLIDEVNTERSYKGRPVGAK